MENHDALMVGMFWGGLLMSAVPLLLGLGIGFHVLRRFLAARRDAEPECVTDPVSLSSPRTGDTPC